MLISIRGAGFEEEEMSAAFRYHLECAFGTFISERYRLERYHAEFGDPWIGALGI